MENVLSFLLFYPEDEAAKTALDRYQAKLGETGDPSILSGQQRQGLWPGWARAKCGRDLDTSAGPPAARSTSRPAAQWGCPQGWGRRAWPGPA